MKQNEYIDFVARIEQGNPSPGGLALLRQALSSFPFKKGSKVLEIGSNTGSSTAAIAEFLPNHHIIGIDIEPEMVKVAKNHIRELQSENILGNNVEIKVDDAENLSYENEYFDLVVSGGTLSFVDNPKKAVREITRVLKPGGFFLSLEYCYVNTTPPEKLLNEIKEILGFDVSNSTIDYWNDIHFDDSLTMEGIYVHKPYIHRAKKIKNTVDSVNYYLKERGKELASVDKENLIKALDVFQRNEEYASICTFTLRKWKNSKLMVDTVN